nr:amino acid adenylation domain-containing protein [Dickeya dianthicola]
MPMSFSQTQLWIADKMDHVAGLYNIFETFRLSGELDKHALVNAITCLIKRHEVLRTVYPSGEYQLILPAPETFSVSFISLETTPEPSDLDNILRAEMHAHFDLESDLMLRVQVLSSPGQQHYLSLNTHHIASDGWSMDIMRREISALYNAFTAGHEASLQPLTLQVADIAFWQRKQTDNHKTNELINYWKKQLKGCAPLHSLPLDFPRTPESHGKGADIHKKLPQSLTDAFEKYCIDYNATPFMGMYSLFSLILSQVSGEQDVVIGTTNANREIAGCEGLIGYFVNSLVLRLDVPRTGRFSDLLMKSRDVTIEAYAHQSLPFERLVSECAPVRDSTYHPLFQISINMVNTRQSPLKLHGLDVEEIALATSSSPFDLTLHIFVEEGHYNLVWEYNPTLFMSQTIESYHRQFESLMRRILSQDLVSLDELEHHEDPLQQEIISLGTGQQVDIQERSFTGMWLRQVKHTPNAIVYDDKLVSFSYQEIDAKSDQLAVKLLAAGVSNLQPVGIYLPRSVEMLIAIVAIFKAGSYYVPLDYNGPSDRNTYILHDANVDHVISSYDDASTMGVVCIDPYSLGAELADFGFSLNECALAYAMYTSGSTGQPKGVEVTQHGLANYLTYCKHTYLNKDVTRSLWHGPLTFDATLTSLLAPVVMGLRLTALPMGQELELLSQEIYGESALIKITPAHLSILTPCLNMVESHKAGHVFVIGGENLTWEILTPWLKAFPNARFFNEYGPTETVVGCCVYEVSRICQNKRGSVPIGRPIFNTQLFVMKENRPSLPYQKGELCIAGPGVANGYIRREELTADKFTSLHLNFLTPVRVYRSGDIVAWQRSKELMYYGREDAQIKINGYRIELQEIVHAIQHCTAIRDVVVIVKDKLLLAFIQNNGDDSLLSEGSVKADLIKLLPHYMVPNRVLFLDSLPVTDSGKFDRNKMASIDHESPSSTHVLPNSMEEVCIHKLWIEILTLNRPVSIDENFFELGGSSLHAVKLTIRINQCFDVSMSPREVLLNPTIRGLSNYITGKKISEDWQPHTCLIERNAGRTTYFIPGVCGQSAMFLAFADVLRNFTNSIVLEHKGLNGRQPPFELYQSMLDAWLLSIESTQRGGKIILCGHSFGALIAHDLAWLLEQRGYQPLIIMLDACFEDVGADVEELSGNHLTQLITDIYGVTLSEQSTMAIGFKSVYDQHAKFICDYTPLGKIRSPLLYLMAEESPHSGKKNVEQWLEHWAGRYSLSSIRGDHHTMLYRENISTCCSVLEDFIKEDLNALLSLKVGVTPWGVSAS